jgi:hypothetical protein
MTYYVRVVSYSRSGRDVIQSALALQTYSDRNLLLGNGRDDSLNSGACDVLHIPIIPAENDDVHHQERVSTESTREGVNKQHARRRAHETGTEALTFVRWFIILRSGQPVTQSVMALRTCSDETFYSATAEIIV